MSDEADKESKTENASEKRINDALEKGNNPFSREAVAFGSIGATTLAVSMSGIQSGSLLYGSMNLVFDHVADIWLENGGDFGHHLYQVFVAAFVAILPICAIVAGGGIIGAIGQNIPSASLERLRPKFERLSPGANFKRIFGRETLVDFAKSLLKLSVVGVVIYKAISDNLLKGALPIALNVYALPVLVVDVVKSILFPVCIVAFVIAVADLVFARIKWNSDLKMTRQEVKEEFKQSQGDPMLKERIKNLGRQRARNRMMANVPKATMVIVNPTHFSVALRYVPAENSAPLVVAKGLDHLALKIRRACEEIEIPVIENRELARGLHGACEVGTTIPVEFYRAVAEIVHYVEVRKRLINPKLAQA